jgi:hypothetical protein
LEKLFGVLFSVYRGTPKQGEWVIACLQGAWPKIIGDRLAGVCAPASFDGSTLVIEVHDRQWDEAVRSIRPALLEKLQNITAGEVKRIRIIGRQSAVSGNHELNADRID